MGAGGIDRREVLRRAMWLGSALAWPSAAAMALEYQGGTTFPWAPGVADYPYYGLEDDRFLTADELTCLDAVTARLIPTDDEGPGAREANVAGFIDRQLAGFYGRGQRWYMAGPWPEGAPTQGYQTHLTPAELYRAGLRALDLHARANFADRGFAQLDDAEQDEILTGLDEEEIEFDDLPAKQFFDLVLENTIEGFFCDPIYGGNRDMVGWRLVGFPGARYDYRDYINHNGARLDIPPVGLAGRPEWSSER